MNSWWAKHWRWGHGATAVRWSGGEVLLFLVDRPRYMARQLWRSVGAEVVGWWLEGTLALYARHQVPENRSLSRHPFVHGLGSMRYRRFDAWSLQPRRKAFDNAVRVAKTHHWGAGTRRAPTLTMVGNQEPAHMIRCRNRGKSAPSTLAASSRNVPARPMWGFMGWDSRTIFCVLVFNSC